MEFEISCQKFKLLDKNALEVIDVREKDVFEQGHIFGAKCLSMDELLDYAKDLSTKTFVLYCQDGKESKKLAQKLKETGCDAHYLANGYAGWIKSQNNLKSAKQKTLTAEESIRGKFHRQLLSKFAKALNEYELLKPGDKVAVCISGGKDSMCMAKLFQEIKRHNKMDFDVEFLVMDPGYSKKNREIIERNAKILGVPITIFETDIFKNVYHINSSPCYMCARMRRGSLYAKAKELGCNKIALGHHYDDVIETILMGMLYGAQVQTMMPKLHSNNFEGMELIRPMYLIREQDIKHWRDFNNLYFIQCACKMTELYKDNGEKNLASKRKKVKKLIAELSKDEQQIEGNIFRSVEGVNLATVISFKDKNGKIHSFLDDYDQQN